MPREADYRRVLALSAELSGEPSPRRRRDRITAALRELVPGDDTFFTRLDLASSASIVDRGDGRSDPAFARDITRTAGDNPAVESYLGRPWDLAPRRMSDVRADADWLRTASYNEVFRARGGRYQLSLVCRLDVGRSAGEGWIVTRSSFDFTDDDVELAAVLLPLLVYADGVGVPGAEPGRGPQPPLTRTEVEVLRLLAKGLTARAIGSRRGVSPQTVRKHLEHIFAKFDVHDRLEVTLLADALGLPA